MKKGNEMPKNHVSFTQISLYATCPAWYKTRYWDNYKGTRSVPLIFGAMIHDVVSETNNLIISLKKKDDLVVEEVKAIYDKEWKKNDLGFDLYNKGWDMVLDHAERTFTSRADVFKAEYEVKIELVHKEDKIILLGYIDRVDLDHPGINVLEYKTGNLLPSHDEVDNNLQMNIYTFMIHKQFPEHDRIHNTFYALSLKKMVKVEKDLSKFDNFDDYLIELWQKMAKDQKFEPKLNSKCFWCPKKCDLYSRLLKEQLQDEKAANDIPGLIRQFKNCKANLKTLKAQKDLVQDILMKQIAEQGSSLETKDEVVNLIEKHRAGYTSEVQPCDWQELKVQQKWGAASTAKKGIDKKNKKV